MHKKLLLILLMPSVIICGDNPVVAAIVSVFQSWQRFEQQNPSLAFGIKQGVSEAISDKMAADARRAERQKQQEQYEIHRLQQERLRLEQEKKNTEQKVKRDQEEAKRKEGLLHQDLERCLSSHFGIRENAHGFPRRCGSPARRYAAVNEQAADLLIGKYKNKRKEGIQQQQFRVWL